MFHDQFKTVNIMYPLQIHFNKYSIKLFDVVIT